MPRVKDEIMSAEQLDRLRTLLSAAVHLPWPQRADYLRQRCPDDALVRDEALSLVELYDSADGFLTKPFPEMLGARAAEPVHLPPGTLLHGRFPPPPLSFRRVEVNF